MAMQVCQPSVKHWHAFSDTLNLVIFVCDKITVMHAKFRYSIALSMSLIHNDIKKNKMDAIVGGLA